MLCSPGTSTPVLKGFWHSNRFGAAEAEACGGSSAAKTASAIDARASRIA